MRALQHQYIGDCCVGISMHRRLFVVSAMSSALAANSACAQAQTARAVETIPLDLSGPRLTAQLRIAASEPVTAIFDTGAAGSVLKLSYATRIGAPNQGPAAAVAPGGTPINGYRTTIEGRLGNARFGRAMAVALDIPLPLEGIDAIISPSVFSGRLVRFDFPRSVAEILPKTAAAIPVGPGTSYHGDNHGGHMVRRIPAVELVLPGQPALMAIADTGASRGLLLPLRMAASLPLASPLAPAPPVRMVGIAFEAQTARLRGVARIGALELREPEITFVDGETPANVGFSILRQAVLVLDPEAHRSWLLPASSASH